MNLPADRRLTRAATVLFDLLNPLPYAFFVAALIFDAIYSKSGEILWDKGAAWLISIGLVFAIVPRLINLVRVWKTGAHPRPMAESMSFWLNLFAIVAATINAFVHSRDAYGSMPEGLMLSVLTVALLATANVVLSLNHSRFVVQR